MERLAAALLLAIVASTGCTTSRSTMLNRQEDGHFSKNSKFATKGVPITLKVPTHLDVRIVETYFLEDLMEDDSKFADLREVDTKRRILSVDVTPVETEQVFTVDWKRPAAGVLEYGATMGDDQYFDTIKGEVVDRTIEDVSKAIAAIPGILGRKTSADVPSEIGNVISNTRVVAYQRFDINACDFEQQVLAFVTLHLNACHDCAGFKLPFSGEATGLESRPTPAASPARLPPSPQP